METTLPAGAPLAAYRTKTDLVYEALRRAIIAGAYPPGTRIVADRIAEALSVSKVPVREAMVKLVGEGWLETVPHVGAIVPRLKPDEILETAIARAALEGAAYRFAAEHLTDEALRHIERLLEMMDDAAASGSDDYVRLNFEFHAAITAACPFPSLRSMARSLAEKSFRLRTTRFVPQHLPRMQQEHRAIVEAVKRKDGAQAERLCRQHVEDAGRHLWRFALAEEARRAAGGDAAAPARP